MSLTLKEITSQLEHALEDFSQKKAALDKANEEASKASDAYQTAMRKAQDLRQQLDNSLESILPTNKDNVRVRIPAA